MIPEHLHMTYQEKLSEIRKQMKADQVGAYIIPSADPHISEYLPKRYACIPFVSGFRGSAGTLVITADFAGLWTDFRYFEQATAELEGSGFELVKQKVQHAPEYIEWLKDTLPADSRVAADEKLLSVLLGELIVAEMKQADLAFLHRDYINPIWSDRPELPAEPAFLISAEAAGATVQDKLIAVREAMAKAGTDHHLISSLDDMAWLFNIRGKDVNFNPVVLSFALINQDHAKIYIQLDKLTEQEKVILLKSGVEVLDYTEIEEALATIPANSKVLIDPKRNCYAYLKLLPSTAKIVRQTNPSTQLKACKNEVEAANTREAMRKDGIAITKFLKWLEENIGRTSITEISAADHLRAYRAEADGYAGDSFDTISAYAAHGALPHYKASQESNVALEAKGLYLIDSGGQYHYGTTDITRTVPLGETTAQERKDYTLVLKGMIEGCRLQFPAGTCGYQIDAVTRRPLWEHGINYGHGTGHGVGYYLNVHEGPQVFNATATPVPVEIGMITSIEPGVYRPGRHGIRIENLVLTVAAEQNEFNDFLAFETLTIAPIHTGILDLDLLEQAQRDWLNAYHEMVYERLSPGLSADEAAWLKKATEAI